MLSLIVSIENFEQFSAFVQLHLSALEEAGDSAIDKFQSILNTITKIEKIPKGCNTYSYIALVLHLLISYVVLSSASLTVKCKCWKILCSKFSIASLVKCGRVHGVRKDPKVSFGWKSYEICGGHAGKMPSVIQLALCRSMVVIAICAEVM